MNRVRTLCGAAVIALAALCPQAGKSACCYFSAKDKDVLQPGQKAFLTYDPATKMETFTVQPRFEGNADDFGMVIPTPAKPKLDEMPRDFFKHLAVYTILKKREQPESKLLPVPVRYASGGGPMAPGAVMDSAVKSERPRKPEVKVLEAGVVGNLDYKIIEAGRADDLFQWLKDNRYQYGGDESTLDFYIKKKWLFTVMKIDTAQMKRDASGKFLGEITPTRFQFTSDQFVYPLKITQISVKDKTEALFYVQAPFKCDLQGDMTYQYQWVPMIQNARGWYDKRIFGGDELPGKADSWLKTLGPNSQAMIQRGQQLGYGFVSGQRPQPNDQGKTATTLEWACKLSLNDVKLLKGESAFGEKVPDPDEGFTQKDVDDASKREEVFKTIRARLDKWRQERPGGYLVREAPEADVKALKNLLGHLKEGQFVTKFRRTFVKAEMSDDLTIIPAAFNGQPDVSEYTEILPTSPP